MKYLKPFNESNESNENDLTVIIRDILADATDEGIQLQVATSGPLNDKGYRSYVEVTLYKGIRYLNRPVDPFTLKDIKTGVDTLINTLEDDGDKVIKTEMFDDQGTSSRYDISKFIDPWDYLQSVIEDNSFQRTYPDKDFQLRLVKLWLRSSGIPPQTGWKK